MSFHKCFLSTIWNLLFLASMWRRKAAWKIKFPFLLVFFVFSGTTTWTRKAPSCGGFWIFYKRLEQVHLVCCYLLGFFSLFGVDFHRSRQNVWPAWVKRRVFVVGLRSVCFLVSCSCFTPNMQAFNFLCRKSFSFIMV